MDIQILKIVPLAAILCSGALCSNAQERSPYIYKVYEYRPAPGQFINTLPECGENDTEADVLARCNEILACEDAGMICLGSFGGYVTFGFDHPIVNVQGEYDLYLKGNAFKYSNASDGGSSEPGIVMVSTDANGNGVPDDEWYELSGSADVDSVGKVVYDYEITYTYSPMVSVAWRDNRGQSGVVARNAWHTQEYFPLWLAHEGEITFRGTLLPSNVYKMGNYTVQRFLRYGYVDNCPNETNGRMNEECCFNLDWAVDANRKPVKLEKVDFVRVYSAMNQHDVALGETSTEFAGAVDLHPMAEATGIDVVCPSNDIAAKNVVYDLMGRRVKGALRGLVVRNGKLELR